MFESTARSLGNQHVGIAPAIFMGSHRHRVEHRPAPFPHNRQLFKATLVRTTESGRNQSVFRAQQASAPACKMRPKNKKPSLPTMGRKGRLGGLGSNL